MTDAFEQAALDLEQARQSPQRAAAPLVNAQTILAARAVRHVARDSLQETA